LLLLGKFQAAPLCKLVQAFAQTVSENLHPRESFNRFQRAHPRKKGSAALSIHLANHLVEHFSKRSREHVVTGKNIKTLLVSPLTKRLFLGGFQVASAAFATLHGAKRFAVPFCSSFLGTHEGLSFCEARQRKDNAEA